ncbi:hypothetical protein [Micromonospora sp. RV43]|uniref:hypothetical protein n=1 Tax=Micromonospora sp. RV43 TaxID=1661387 RepID=UPI000AC7155A|nr:hypothetical protein [Micromonospora sp. RV43]
MLSAITLLRALAPPRRRNASRWQAGSTAACASTAVTDAGDVTSDEFAWGYAIRRQWPHGAHDLFGFTPDAATARRRLDRDRRYWRRGPVRPAAVYLVAANAADVSRHPVDGCRRSCCPDSTDRGQW